jgi:hypothetical protein
MSDIHKVNKYIMYITIAISLFCVLSHFYVTKFLGKPVPENEDTLTVGLGLLLASLCMYILTRIVVLDKKVDALYGIMSTIHPNKPQ